MFLSNFYVGDPVEYLGLSYATSEHLFQSMKCVSTKEANWVRLSSSPGIAKRRGNLVKIHKNWNDIRVDCMRETLGAKFQHFDLRQRLMATKPAELIEGNTWGDTFWGEVNGRGENWLGRLLMEIRDANEYLRQQG